MRFSTRPIEEATPIYRLTFFQLALFLITPDNEVFSFDQPPKTEAEQDLLYRVIKSFLLTNPSGFQRITDTMVLEYEKTHKFKALLEYMEKTCTQIVSSLQESVLHDASDFEAVRRFPKLTSEGAFTRKVPEYLYSYAPLCRHWTIESSSDGLLEIYQEPINENGRVRKFVCRPLKNDEEFLTPSIFKEAAKAMLALDRDAFLEAFNVLRTHYLNTEPAWTSWFHQMSLMVDVYRLHQSKMEQASHFCWWIDYN